MSKDTNRKFNWRAFASVLTGLSCIGMTFTGIILFVVPPGRIANWTGWTMIRLTKHQWIALHTWFSLIFVVGAALHIYLNWKPLVGYFKSKLSKSFALRSEWILALVVCVVVYFGTLWEIVPFSSLIAWNESIKHSWDTPRAQGPIPHAELLTLTELAKQVEGVDLQTMLDNLKTHSIEVDSPDTVLGNLAEAHNMTPIQLYNIALGQTGAGGQGGAGRGAGGQGQGLGGGHGSGGAGRGAGRGGSGQAGQDQHATGAGGQIRGFGRMTLKEYCTQTGLDTPIAIKKLKDAGYQAGEDMTFRDIADTAGIHPSEIRTILEPTAR